MSNFGQEKNQVVNCFDHEFTLSATQYVRVTMQIMQFSCFKTALQGRGSFKRVNFVFCWTTIKLVAVHALQLWDK